MAKSSNAFSSLDSIAPVVPVAIVKIKGLPKSRKIVAPEAVAPVAPEAVAPVAPEAVAPVAPVAPVAVAPVAPVAVAPVAPVAVAPVAPVAPVEPVIKKLALSFVKLHFDSNFKRMSLSEQRKASKDKTASMLFLVDTYVGYALHKIHSGMGENEPGMSDARDQVFYSKDGKKTLTACLHFEVACDILRNVPNKALCMGTIEEFESFKVTIEASFINALITAPAAKKEATNKASTETSTETSTEASTETSTEPLPTELIDVAVSNIILTLDALNMTQLITLQAAITKAINAIPPM